MPYFSKVRRLSLLALCNCLLSLGLVACSHAAPEHRAAKVGLANPASVYCVKRGGHLVFTSAEKGVTGFCHLVDGTTVEEWSLYRQAHAALAPNPFRAASREKTH